MFTGIVKGAFPVKSVKKTLPLLHYGVELPDQLLKGLEIGASVSVDGICQTVAAIENNIVFFDAIKETLERTTLDELKIDQYVNIERAARFGDEIGGHYLSGHIFGTAKISEIHENMWKISCDPSWMKYIFEKGFIAIDGVSLTVGQIEESGFFYLHLIPETLKTTSFSNKEVGQRVNIEFDSQTQTIVDTVEKFLKLRLNANF